MLFTLTGIHILEEWGAFAAADMARRTDPNIEWVHRRNRVREVVEAMILETQPADLCIALVTLDDADVYIAAFEVFSVVMSEPESGVEIAQDACAAVAIWYEKKVPLEWVLRALVLAVISPWLLRRMRYRNRIASRNLRWIRRDLITRILEKGAVALAEARTRPEWFYPNEYDRLERDIRLGTEKRVA